MLGSNLLLLLVWLGQLKQAHSYTAEHCAYDGHYEIMIHKEASIMIAQIRSRCQSSKVFNL